MQDGSLLRLIEGRRSIRQFTCDPVPKEAIIRILEAGRNAPSGANRQPWRYIVIDNPAVKQALRSECERSERIFHRNAPDDLAAWMAAYGITPEKPFLEEAPILIAVFYDKHQPYAVPSVWISIGFMLLQVAAEGLGTLTYTPAGARLNDLLGVPEPFWLAVILPLGIPADNLRQDRRPLLQTASMNRFGSPFK